jgi:hypothetical protein
MKNLLLVVLLVCSSVISNAQQQDSIKSYPGIPIITYGYDLSKHPAEQFIGMDEAGIYALEASNLTAPIFNQKIGNNNLDLKVMPEQITDPLGNYIVKYTEARYTEWEAEGTNPQDGLITLYHDSINCIEQNGAVVTTSITPNDTIIYGPMYSQEKTYSMVDANQEINYTLKTLLKLEDLQPGQTLLGDTVCIVQVTTRTSYNEAIHQWQLGTPEKIIEKAVTYGELLPLNQWKGIDTTYNLMNVPAQYSQANEMPYQVNRKFLANGDNSVQSLPRESVHNIEFRVIWKGNSQKLRLSIDKFIVYDGKGWDLINLLGPTTQISTQLSNNQTAFNQQVAGWIGFDEPWDLDTWAPIKKVKEIIESYSPNASIWFQFNTKWNGRFSNYYDPAYSAKIVIIDEFMRRVKKANVWVTSWLYDMPCDEYDTGDPCDGDYKEINIDFAADSIYKKILDASKIHPDLFYGMSIQTGRYFDNSTYDGNDRIREISGSDLLYQTNLALMYGAKLISPWLYFGEENATPETREYTGFRNPPNYPVTDKYLMLKNKIAPRLSSLMGQTLKTLTPTEQYLKINSSGNYNFIGYFSGNLECLPAISDYDLGFFTDSQSRDYFMLISRYYNNDGACPIFINLDEGCLYNNLVLTKFVADTTYNILRSDPIPVNLTRGDAELYRIYPVVRWGGSLLANDTTNSGETLHSDMIVENNSTLVINGTYYANADITVKAGGKIKYGSNNSKIVFSSGKKLIIQGVAEIKGTSSSNKLALQFSGNNTAVLVKPGSSLTMDYCNITGAYQGIVTETGARSYVNISNSNISSTYCAISLASGSSSEDITSQIYKCNLTSTLYGISASNYNLILIQENTLAGCGINISNSSSVFLQGNVITGSGSATTYGIFLSSSTGYVRNNIISNCLNGLHLANSSPDVGSNILQGNIRHGMYIGSGSIPNLVGHLQINPPLYFPLSGFNKIYSNGSATSTNPVDNDGSEIYLASSNILLANGCNQISDDRLSTPSMNTQYLISGSLNNGGRTLSAIYNYWGTRTIAANRFKNITVIYSPNYIENCPLPDGGSGGGGSETLVLRTSTGLVVDTLIAAEGVPENYSTLQVVYSEADNLYATGNVTQAKPLYEQIVTGNYTSEEKLSAYNKLYAIGNLTGEDETYFTSLQTTFEDIANNEADTLIKKVYNQNAIKCDVSKEEYVTAINKFDEIIQQNPNSEEAVYAEIDIITTALNIDTTNPGLGKLGGKYLVKGTSDYLTKLNDILQSKFGVNSEEGKQIIPTEYSLYQNYPNPFNPTTTIKFDIPDVGTGLAQSNVTLKVYDILGKEIATLVNEDKSAGVYEISFDASTLASGVYIYKLQAGDFVNSKKMILLK